MRVAEFSTLEFHPGERIEVWTERIWSALGRLRARTDTGCDFNGAVRFGDVGSIKLCDITVGPHRIERTPELIRCDDRGLLKIVFQLKGRCFVEQGGERLLLSPGEWSIYDASRPYCVTNFECIELLAMLVPRDRLTSRSLDVSRCALQRFSASAGLGRVIHQYMRCLMDDLPAFDAALGGSLADTAVELVRLAVLERVRSVGVLSAGGVLMERIKACVQRRLRNPTLSIDTIARDLNCSKRYLHKIFGAEGGESLGQYIWNARLERCRADLLDPRLQRRSVTEIAFSWGFNNAAHFSRSFKARFGVAPSRCRTTVGTDAAPAAIRAQLPDTVACGLNIAKAC